MRQVKEFIGNEPSQVVDPAKGDKKGSKKTSKRKLNPGKYINTAPTIDEATKNGVAVISFGRMNPVTIGHEKLVNSVISTAMKRSGTPMIFLSHTTDKKKNPLTYDQKISFAQKAFGKVVQKSPAKTILQVAEQLQGKYKELVVVAGSDRVDEFNTLLNKYNGNLYTFDKITVVSAGERDPDAEGVEGMSASKMRAIAKEGDVATFKKGLPRKLQSQAQKVMDTVRSGMGVNEEFEESEDLELVGEALTHQQRVKRRQIMRRLKSKIAMGRRRAMRRKASTDVLKKRARRMVINKFKDKFAKSKRYADLPYSQRVAIDKKIAKIPQARIDILMRRYLPKVRDAEKARLRIATPKPANPIKSASSTAKREEFNISFEAFLEHLNKTPLQMAVELAENLGGNMNYAIKEIEKIKKGISRHYLVKEALQKANENFCEESYQRYTLEKRLDEGPTYHTGLSKSTADKRKAQFKKQAKMDDDNPAAYKPAPGDKTAKTKPSQHTSKFKQMFGESNYEKAYLKKPHMLLAKNGSVKIDKRFKMFKKSSDDMMLAQTNNKIVKEDVESIMEQADFIFESNPKAAIKKKAEKTGISYGILKKVFDRGVAAWRTGHRPGTTPTQWGLARINSFATGGKTRTTADKDLWAKHKGSKND